MVRVKIIHYRQLFLNRPDPIAFLSVSVDTSVRIYDDFSRLLFLHAHRESSALENELPEEVGIPSPHSPTNLTTPAIIEGEKTQKTST